MLSGPVISSGHRKYGVTPTDTIFLVFLGLVVIGVCWLGKIAYLEGGKTEISKRNGEVWLAWFAKVHILEQREHPFWVNVNSDSEGT